MILDERTMFSAMLAEKSKIQLFNGP